MLELYMVIKISPFGAGPISFGINPCLLDVIGMDSKRNSGKERRICFKFLWEGTHEIFFSLGKMDKDYNPKSPRGMGIKKKFFLSKI